LKNEMKDSKLEELSYEEALQKLEKIVRRLEDPEIALEESLALFQEGIALSRYCRDKLTEIEYKVEYLLKEEQQNSIDISGGQQSISQDDDEHD